MNRLEHASSPYLRQHAGNPVDWHEWGEEAFADARRRDVPIFLSVGYSSCHWCHVMAHESFEDEPTAKLLNENFVPVKVDREERPDVDAVYMAAVQAMTGRGGWPMSVFLTPAGEPFYGGTYWPLEPRHGMPGFGQVLEAVAEAWRGDRAQVSEQARRLTTHVQQVLDLRGGARDAPAPGGAADGGTTGTVDASVAARAAAACVAGWDRVRGGFGRAPKFPQAMTIDFLLAHHLRTGDPDAVAAAASSLEAMSRGGIYDHVGGGFARYSTDEDWLVPHFEKMLYDNALLLRAYSHAWQVTTQRRFRRVALEIADYLLREMQHPDGGFYSATDADSEGEEGRFFVWTDREFREVVATTGEDPGFWAEFYGVTPQGNFEGRSILHEAAPRNEQDEDFGARVDRVRAALYARRAQRVPPGLDDKVLCSWNALALGALAEAGAALGAPALIDAAARTAAFLRNHLVSGTGLHHTWSTAGGARVPAFAEDFAYLAQGLLSLYEAGHDPQWFIWARALAAEAQDRFADGQTGTYFSTAHDAEALVARPKDLWDNATPAPASVLADVHLRLAGLTGQAAHHDAAERILAAFAPQALEVPTAYGELLRALERRLAGPREVAVVGPVADPATSALVAVYREAWRPGAVLAVGEDGDQVPLLADRTRVDGRPAAYVCELFACRRPVTDPAELLEALGG